MAEKGYKKGRKWAGHDNFECNNCEFSTINEELMEEHVRFHDSLQSAVDEDEEVDLSPGGGE